MNNNPNPINCESQNVAIARYLEEGGRLTPLLALDLFGCFRLAARIGELRNKGMVIERLDIPVKNSKGRTVFVGEYFLGAAE
ncbi:hypothetical protein D3C84_1066910 [compost metagenome]